MVWINLGSDSQDSKEVSTDLANHVVELEHSHWIYTENGGSEGIPWILLTLTRNDSNWFQREGAFAIFLPTLFMS